MKTKRILYPGFLGLSVYMIIRLINDTLAGENHFTHADIWTLIIEIATSISTAYVFWYVWRRYESYLEAHSGNVVNVHIILKELLQFIALGLVIINLTITPMAALTDNGLSWSDFTLFNLTAIFGTMIWFFYRRTYKYLEAYTDSKVKLEKLETAKAKDELKFLKSQIQPHFLFNTLNTVYFQIDEDQMAAKGTIEELSTLLRYGLYEPEDGKVLLSEELKYIDSYVHVLNKRKEKQIKFIKTLSGKTDIKVAPHLIIPLVENAFKHMSDDNEPITFEINSEGGYLDITVKNPYKHQVQNGYSKGIGLTNLKKRLDYLYPGRHEFTTSAKDGLFAAQLKILLND
jgi:hypothetical protein